MAKRTVSLKPRTYKTRLTPEEETQFSSWYKNVSQYKGLDANPDSDEQYYDYRGFWKNEGTMRDSILKEGTDAHFIDRYKIPGHPTFSTESMYSGPTTQGGSWSQGPNNEWIFNHSKYTLGYSDRTEQYLRGTGEYHAFNGGMLLPKVTVKSARVVPKTIK